MVQVRLSVKFVAKDSQKPRKVVVEVVGLRALERGLLVTLARRRSHLFTKLRNGPLHGGKQGYQQIHGSNLWEAATAYIEHGTNKYSKKVQYSIVHGEDPRHHDVLKN